MIHSQIEQDGTPLYWMVCDHCGDFTLQYETPEKLAYEALEAGWRREKTLGKDFCCRYCELSYLAKLFKKGGEA